VLDDKDRISFLVHDPDVRGQGTHTAPGRNESDDGCTLVVRFSVSNTVPRIRRGCVLTLPFMTLVKPFASISFTSPPLGKTAAETRVGAIAIAATSADVHIVATEWDVLNQESRREYERLE
jgi:hypothetical protein